MTKHSDLSRERVGTTIHPVLGLPLDGPWPQPYEVIYLGMGCFWGAERIFWRAPAVLGTAVGYLGGHADDPSYEDVCTSATGHAEVVRVVYDCARTNATAILQRFWENHDPTQGDRQGNDVGSQYRSLIAWTTPSQCEAAYATRDAFQPVLSAAGFGPITTQIIHADASVPFYLAEGYHQAYLHHLPNGYCNLGPSGLTCPTGVVSPDH